MDTENPICLLAITSRTVFASAHRAAPWLLLPHLARFLSGKGLSKLVNGWSGALNLRRATRRSKQNGGQL